MRRSNLRASGFSWYELQDQTWRRRWFWADHSMNESTIQSFCSNFWRNNHWIRHWSSDRKNSWHLWTWKCISITKWFKTDIICCDILRKESDELHILNSEFRSNTELLSELQKVERCETSIPETCANSLSVFPSQVSLFTRRTLLTTDKNFELFFANSSDGGAPPTAVSKMVVRLVRHYDQDERTSDAAVLWDTTRSKLLRAFANSGVQDFSDKDRPRYILEGSCKTRFESCEDSKNSLTYFRTIQEHSGGITIDPELIGTFWFPANGKEYVFHRDCSFSIITILENGLIPKGKESKGGRQIIFFTPPNPFRENPDEEEPRDENAIPEASAPSQQLES